MTTPKEKEDMVMLYMKERFERSIKKIEPMLDDQVVLQHESDGTFVGKQQVLEYLKTAEPRGEWQDAKYNESTGTVLIRGTVNQYFINWSVVGEFFYNEKGKIIKITVGRG